MSIHCPVSNQGLWIFTFFPHHRHPWCLSATSLEEIKWMCQRGKTCRMQEQWLSWDQLLCPQNMLFHGGVRTGCSRAGKGSGCKNSAGQGWASAGGLRAPDISSLTNTAPFRGEHLKSRDVSSCAVFRAGCNSGSC